VRLGCTPIVEEEEEVNPLHTHTHTHVHTRTHSHACAGGGSRLMYRDGLFVVGPESVGANPGPVAYGRQAGRDAHALQPAITDANVVLGRIVPAAFPRVRGARMARVV